MVTEKYDDFIALGRRRLLGLKVDDYDLYKALYLALISVNIERDSFLCLIRMFIWIW